MTGFRSIESRHMYQRNTKKAYSQRTLANIKDENEKN